LPGERNSVYTKYLLKALKTKAHLNYAELFIEVRKQVSAETQDVEVQQVPWEANSLTRKFCFGTCQDRERAAELEQQQKKLAQERAELERQRLEQERLARERAAELERQRVEQEKLARERAELERQRLEQERLAQQRATELERQRLEQERLAQQRAAELERQRAELERQRIEQERLARQRAELEKQRLEQEKRAQQRANKSYRYTDNGDGTVTDNRSGLIWMKNANCFGRQNWETAMQSAANLAHGQCGLSDGSRRGMWRLPTKEEWKAMVDKKYRRPALSNAAGTGQWEEGDAFLGVQKYSWYWSYTTENLFSAWDVYLNDGFVYYNVKTFTLYVWAVRGGH
jgi:hypothetical protein